MVGKDRFGGIFYKLRTMDFLYLRDLFMVWHIIDGPEEFYDMSDREVLQGLESLASSMKRDLSRSTRLMSLEGLSDQERLYNIDSVREHRGDLVKIQDLSKKLSR